MPGLHLSCFLNDSLPVINDPAVNELPVALLGDQLCTQLESSLRVNPDNKLKCAESARLWESLLEKYRVPYLLLRVADVHYTLNSHYTAFKLYQELQTQIQNPELGQWLETQHPVVMSAIQKQSQYYKMNGSFSHSQRWRSTAQVDNQFPYCRLPRASLQQLKTDWLNLGAVDKVMAWFKNLHCLESNAIEGTVRFELSATTKLIQVGFYNRIVPVSENSIVGGAVRDRGDALSILRDTHQALDDVFDILISQSPNLTVEIICRLHRTLMKTSRVLSIKAGGQQRLAHINVGVTRTATYFEVTATSGSLKIQFCPSESVDAELSVFCERFNELLKDESMDPFAAAAWISHVFVTIHPFEDGNGRLSRILSSVPLVRKGYPLLCVSSMFKQAYIDQLNFVRANRDGDYSQLMEILFKTTEAAVTMMKYRKDVK